MAQGSLLKKGADGIGFHAGFARDTNNNHSLSIAAIFTGEGIVDFGVTASFLEGGEFGSANKSIGILTELYVLRVSRSNNIPIAASLFGDFSRIEDETLGTLGMSIYKRGMLSHRSFIQYFFSIFKAWSSSDTGRLGIIIGLNLAGSRSSSGLFNVTPAIAITEKTSTYGISLGYTIGPTGFKREGPPEFD